MKNDRTPPGSRSPFGPKSVVNADFESLEHHAMDLYGPGNWKRLSAATPYQPVIVEYPQEVHDAFAEAIKTLCSQNPVHIKNRAGRKKLKSRAAAVHLATQGSRHEAFARAIYGGLPREQLRAIETLIFG